MAEAYLETLSSLSTYPSHRLSMVRLWLVAACGASMWPASSFLHQPRSLTFATVTTSSSLVGSLSSLGLNASILHGEVYALVSIFLLSVSSSSPMSIFSDHLPSVCCISSTPTVPSSLRSSLTFSPARSLYRWLRSLMVANPHCSVQHVRAHTQSTSSTSLANKLVDLYATSAQHRPYPPPPVPVPTFTMDRLTPFYPSFGDVETNLSSFVPHLLASTLPRLLFPASPPIIPLLARHSSATGPSLSACSICVFGNTPALPALSSTRHCRSPLPAAWGHRPLLSFGLCCH